MKSLTNMKSFNDFVYKKSKKEDADDDVNWSLIPDSTLHVMKPHQMEALNFLNKKRRGLISLGPGAGKTLIGCAFIKSLGSSDSTLIICPTGKVIDWGRDYARWMGETYSGVITTPDKLKNATDMLSHKFSVAVFDEAHAIKTHDSQRTLALLPLLSRIPNVCLLTGTPQQNNAYELWPLLHVIEPSVFNDFYHFRDTFCVCETFRVKGREIVRYTGQQNEDLLHLILNKVSYRKEGLVTTDVEFQRVDVMFDLPEEEVAHFEELTETFREMKKNEDPTIQTHVNFMWQEAGRVKASLCSLFVMNLVSKAVGSVILFCSHIQVVNILGDLFKDAVKITGETPEKKRDEIVSKLAKREIKVGIFTIRAASEGLNCAPGVTDIVFVELDRTPSRMFQAECRAYRMGAVDNVTAYWLFLKKSWDDVVIRQLQKKQAGNTKLVEGKERVFTF